MAASQADTLNRIFRLTVLKGGGLVLTLGLTMAQAAAFGAGPALDAFMLIRQSLASAVSAVEGALHKLLVPHFLHSEGTRRWDRLAMAPVLIAVLLTLVIWIFAPAAVAGLAPGFDATQAELAVQLLRIFVLGVPVSILVAVLSSRAFAQRRFSLVTAATLLPRLAGLIAFAAVGLTLSVTGLAWWIVGGMGAMGAIVLWVMRRPAPETAPIIAGPPPAHGRRALALLVFFGTQIALTWSNGFLASMGAAGTAALLFLALRLLNAAPGMANSAVAKVYYTEYAATAQTDGERQAAQLSAGIRTGLFFALPVCGLLLVSAEPLIRALLERGAFTAEDTSAMVGLVRLLVPVLVLNTVMASLYTAALADGRLPLLRLTVTSSITTIALRIGIGLWSVPALGLPGLALAILVSSAAQTGLVALVCRQSWGSLITGPFLADTGRLTLAIAAAMAAAWVVHDLALVLQLATFGLTFLVVAIPCGVPEAKHLARLLTRKRKASAQQA